LLQAIARENNLPETAFLVDRGDHYELRWFTPSVEAELCGHATLAAAHVVLRHLHPEWPEVVFRSQRRLLRVSRGQGPALWLSLPALTVTEVNEAEVPRGLLDGLSIPPSMVFAGMDYLAVYDSERAMRALAPRQDILCHLDRRGVIVTSAGSGHDFSSRFFAPKLSIPEDTFTGSTHCALIPFWASRLRKNDLTSRQYSTRFGEPLAIQTDCKLSGREVLIAGMTAEYMSGIISLSGEEPASSADWAPDAIPEQRANGGPA
jgi:predicted PhzF superfamily epimerase YddE/YHI9